MSGECYPKYLIFDEYFFKQQEIIFILKKKITTMQNLVARKTDDGTSVYNSPRTPQVYLQYIWLKFAI